MNQRRLGASGPLVSELGLGCMSLAGPYGNGEERESIATIHRALELGVTLFDTAEMYGPHRCEEIVGKALADRRERAFICTKFGIYPEGPDGSPQRVRAAVEGSLSRLGIETIDLYYQHRVDPKVPIEETVGAMAELVREGKIRYIGLSEAAAETIRRAHATHPIAAVQTEYSLFYRDIEDNGNLATMRELDIALVAYSPLGRGFLTGTVTAPTDFAQDDSRRNHPRFAAENFAANKAIVDALGVVAAEIGATTAQTAIAWVLAQGDDIITIPGTKRVKRLEENAGAAGLILTPGQLERIAEAAPKGAARGQRYADMATVNR
jgi:aryl-alcohol dehydrogenase-like predicted oxidoreductase